MISQCLCMCTSRGYWIVEEEAKQEKDVDAWSFGGYTIIAMIQ